MSPRLRVSLLVAFAAAVAAGATVGATVLTSDRPAAEPRAGARPGFPPLALDLGVRDDPEAAALRRAEALYERGHRAQAGRIFARFPSLQARIGLAFTRWREDGVDGVGRVAAEAPRRAVAQLHLGLALFWAGRGQAAVSAWRRALRVEPDSASAVRADDLLHPRFPRGLPEFVPSFRPPASLARLSPRDQLARLAAAARGGAVRDKLLYGVALQRLGRPVSARHEYAAAAGLAPANVEAQVAAAVGRFSKANPSLAFSGLGPLARRFPHAATVRFHLGLLLLWIGEVDRAKQQLRRAVAVGPSTPLGREAARFLRRLGGIRTG